MTTKTKDLRAYSADQLSEILNKSRLLLVDGQVTHKATIGETLKRLSTLRESDVVARAEVLTATLTFKGSFMLSPSGSQLWGLKPTTRTIDGRKVNMLSIKFILAVADVLVFETSHDEVTI